MEGFHKPTGIVLALKGKGRRGMPGAVMALGVVINGGKANRPKEEKGAGTG